MKIMLTFQAEDLNLCGCRLAAINHPAPACPGIAYYVP
jgi:hypothetical protein